MSKTQPGKRMRKLLSGSQENDAAMNDQAGAAKDAGAAGCRPLGCRERR